MIFNNPKQVEDEVKEGVSVTKQQRARLKSEQQELKHQTATGGGSHYHKYRCKLTLYFI